MKLLWYNCIIIFWEIWLCLEQFTLFYGFHVKHQIDSVLFEKLEELFSERKDDIKFQSIYLGDAPIFENEYVLGKELHCVSEYGFEEFSHLLSEAEKENIEQEVLNILNEEGIEPSQNQAKYFMVLIDL